MARRQHGFTLLELMIVITVMGTMAALIAPGIGEFLADARASNAAEDLVRLSRHLRARAQQSGLAHLLVFGKSSTDAGGMGRIRVYEGMNNHCRQTPWPEALAENVATGHAAVDSISMLSYNQRSGTTVATADDSNRQVIAMTVTGSLAAPDAAVLCIEPTGASYEGTSASLAAGFTFTRQVRPIRFTITRKVNGELRGPARDVLFPPGGIARFKF